jgi:hypothetical protein
MRNALGAEWIIARLTDRNRAAAIIGDLLESVGEEKTFAFWLSVTGIVLSLSWRPITGFVAAFFCGYFLQTLSWHVYHPMGGISPAHDPSHLPLFNALALLIESLWIIAPYALVRYGFREKFAQLAVALWVPVTALFWSWWIPSVAAATLAIVVTIVISSAGFVRWRRPLLAVTFAITLGCVGVRVVYLGIKYLDLSAPLPVRTVADRALPLLAIAAVIAVCELIRRVVVRDACAVRLDKDAGAST